MKPSRQQLLAATTNNVPDVIGPGLKILFCGINPGLYSAAVRHNFARPGNRFWPVLYGAGLTDRLLSPFEERELLAYGIGITNFVERATAAAQELSADELKSGAGRLLRKVRHYKPRSVAVLGISAFRIAFDRRKATVGLQPFSIGQSAVWVLPNPSGLNAHYQLPDLIRHFRAFAESLAR